MGTASNQQSGVDSGNHLQGSKDNIWRTKPPMGLQHSHGRERVNDVDDRRESNGRERYCDEGSAQYNQQGE